MVRKRGREKHQVAAVMPVAVVVVVGVVVVVVACVAVHFLFW